jgi:hypothetical protein
VSSEARAVLGADVTPLFKDLGRTVSKGEQLFEQRRQIVTTTVQHQPAQLA